MNLALFDLDKTLLPIDSDHAWGQFLVDQGIVDAKLHKDANDHFYRQYCAGTLDIEEYLTFALKPMALVPRSEVDEWHKRFMREIITPTIRPQAINLLAKHQDAGDLCAIVTATNEFVTAPIASAFGVPHLIAVQCDTLPDGRLTGTSSGVPSFGSGKITRVESWLAGMALSLESFEQTWFYSDSRNDLPLLRCVTHPVATNADDVLLAEAKAKGWQCLELFSS
jgi:HAD superfamily hydrolase (TIGR01490 family)